MLLHHEIQFMDYLNDNLIKIIAIVISLSSLTISLINYHKFHLKEIQKKQIDIVLELVKKLQSNNLLFLYSKKSDDTITTVRLTNGKIYNQKSKIFKSKNIVEMTSDNHVYFSNELVEVLNLYEFCKNPLLPKTISDSLAKAFPESPTAKSRKDFSIYGEIRILISHKMDRKRFDESHGSKKKTVKNELSYVYLINENFYDFLHQISNVTEEINKWLTKMGVKDLNINWNKQD